MSQEGRNERPNIVLINCDDLGYGDLGCYGSTRNDTPCIDGMAREGLRLTDFYMASPVCSPSRGGMLTGCYPPRIGFGDFDGEWVLFPGQGLGLSSSEETFAQVLKRAGYATGIIGKWHCGDQPEFLPTRRGFDFWYGLPYSNDMGVQAGNAESEFRRRATFPPLPLMEGETVAQQQPDLAALTERYTCRAVEFLRQNRARPFLLYMAHMYVHRPIYAQERFLRESRNGRYGAAVRCVDWSTRVLLWELESLGLRENTLVIFTSDNGSRGRPEEGCSNAPLRGEKGTTWEGGQRVPCILYWPGRIRPRVSHELASSIDFLPSLASLAGEELRSGNLIDGMDLSDFLFRNAERSPRQTFVYYRGNELQAVRKGEWKLHVFRDGAPVRQLYNLRRDVGETLDCAQREPEMVECLLALAQEYRARLGDGGEAGSETRPIGRAENPRMLTSYESEHPYWIAEYDIDDCG